MFKSNPLKRAHKKLQTYKYHPKGQPFSPSIYLINRTRFNLKLPHSFLDSKIISCKTPLWQRLSRSSGLIHRSFNVSNTMHTIFNRSLSLSLDECYPRPSPLPPERYLSIFRRRRRIFSAIISRRRFQVNANLQVTRVSFVCARLYVRVPASSLSLSLCAPAKKKASFISTGKTQNDDEKLMKRMSERVELDCELY